LKSRSLAADKVQPPEPAAAQADAAAVPAALAAQRTFKMTVAYDGTRYAGWQVQLRRQTVQGALEKAIAQVANERVRVTGSGRTDSGVHAIAQVASFSLSRWRARAEDLARALNSKLPPDIAVRKLRDAAADFHAIRDAVGKRYRYQLQIGGGRDAFEYRYRWHLPGPIDVAAMQAAAERLRGRHDFASFQAAGSDRKTTVRDVRALEIIDQGAVGGAGQGSDDPAVQRLAIEVEADGFLYNMVRNIVGTLVEVGRGKRTPAWASEVLAACDRTVAGPTAPPHGLFLLRVDYRAAGCDDSRCGSEML